MANETYDLNFFFRDYVTEDIMSYLIGEVYLYHYKETLFGVRDTRAKTSVFVDLSTIKDMANHYAPTLDQLTEQHIKEAYDEVSHDGETTSRAPIHEIPLLAIEAVSQEMARRFDKLINPSDD